jgi:hypothetical protein
VTWRREIDDNTGCWFFLSTNSLHASLKLVTSSLAISEVKESGSR